MEEIIYRDLNLLQLRKVQYADVRLIHNLTELMVVKNGVVEPPDFSELASGTPAWCIPAIVS